MIRLHHFHGHWPIAYRENNDTAGWRKADQRVTLAATAAAIRDGHLHSITVNPDTQRDQQ